VREQAASRTAPDLGCLRACFPGMMSGLFRRARPVAGAGGSACAPWGSAPAASAVSAITIALFAKSASKRYTE
jgi:hypothetical protein